MKIYWIAFLVVLLDQSAKLIIKETMRIHEVIQVLGTTVQLTYLENPGMAFGIRFFETHPFWGRWFFSVVSIVASIGLVWYIYRTRHERLPYRISLSLILGGAVGNLIDRVVYGRVVDFLDVDMPDVLGLQRWYVFNIADAAVVCGMILMTGMVLFSKPHHVHTEVHGTEAEPSTPVTMSESQPARSE